MSTSVSKIVAERNHRILLELVLKPGNDICADCKARAPRWASHNLGIFICMNCASIHRKIGTHITKVKSITLDQWTKEQVEVMKEKGNIKSNVLYNPNEARHPPPANIVDSERDSELEKFIRSKYEFKRFMDRKSGGTATTSPRSRSTPLTDSAQTERDSSPGPLPPPKTPQNLPPRLQLSATTPSLSRIGIPPTRSVSQPISPLANSDKLTVAVPLRQQAATQPPVQKATGKVWEDLVSLQGPSQSSSLPLQYSPMDSTPFPSQLPASAHQPQVMSGNSPNPFLHLSLGHSNATAPFAASPISVSTPSSQFPFAATTPQPSPALHLGATNPFNQVPLLPSPVTNMPSATFSTSSNPFSSSHMPASMTLSAPTTPSVPLVMAPWAGTPLQTPPLPYAPPPTFVTSAPSFPSTPFAATTAPAPTTAVYAQNSFTPVSAPGQIPPPVNGTTNPFSAMQVGQPGFMAASPQTPFGTTAFLSQQQTQQLHPQQQLGPAPGFGAWAGQGQGTY